MKFLSTILSLLLLVGSVSAAPFEADAKTKRIPEGTTLSIQLLSSVDTRKNSAGDCFNAILLTEQISGANVILPSGSVIRGSVRDIIPAKYFSRGATLYLDFDHVVTPMGRQLPISLGVSGIKTITYDGGIYRTLGYGQAVKDNWTKTCDITKLCTNYGLRAGNAIPGIQFVTAPICAIGGAMGGFCYFFGDSIADLIKKGEEVTLYKGSQIEVMLTQPIDIPVN